MTTDYFRVYPNSDKKILFNGGLNNKYSDSLIADNEASEALNVIGDGFGIKTRPGSRTINTLAVGSFACDGLYTRYDNNGNESMIAFFGGDMYVLSGTTFNSVPSATSVFTAGIRVCAAQNEGYIFVGNGNTPYKYNGAFTRHGVPTPTSIPSVASQDTGVLTGDYRYKVTYVNSAFVEGDIGPTNATFTAASATMRVDLPVAPVSFGVNYRYLYRTETSGSTWKRVTMVTNNTATTYDDNKPDADLGIAATVDIIEMPKYDAILFHPGVGRMFMTDTDNRRYIWYTEANEPYTVKASNFIPIGDFGGDLARGFGIMQNSLLVMADKRPYIIYFPDNDPANWQVIPCKTNYGSSSPFGVVEYGNGIICTALDNKIFQGFQHIVGDTNRPDTSYLTYATIGSDLITDNIEPSMLEVESGYLRNISAITYKNKVYYTVTVNNKTYNNKIFVLDVSPTDIKKAYNASITGMDSYVWLPWAGINVSQFTVYNNKLYGGCSEGLGIVLQLNTDDYTDNDIAINSYWITKQFYGFINESENHKDFRQMFCLADTIDDTYLGVAAKCDSDVGIFTMDAINIDTNANYWGGMVWGQDTWNAGIYQKDITYELGTLNGKRVQFKFSNLNRDNKHFKLHYMSFSYNVKGRR